MIYFSATPDPIFVDLVHTAIDETMDRYLSYDDPRDQEDWFCAGLPRSARFFPASEAKQHLRNLQQDLREDELYEASKYHWLLLYECLDIFCQEFNEQPAGFLVERYGLQRLDFQRIIQLYFRDIGFLEDNIATMASSNAP